jgi:Flp pilus assembly protein TadD
MPKAPRLAPSLVALLISCSALGSTAQAGWFSSDPKPAETPKEASKKDDTAAPQPAATLDDSIRQAQMLRLAGKYDEAIKNLSQLMLVAADDGRVISEYGKTLVSMGRAEEAQKFLARAQQLQPNDWTVYSALGVTYDQIGNQQEARADYERALALKPGEPSVLSNYALSRMLAKDPTAARKLADSAEVANTAAPDDKIKRNIAMIRSMASAADSSATNTPAPSPVPVAAPHVAVATAPLAAPVQHVQPTPAVTRPAPVPVASSAMSHPVAANPVAQAQPLVAQAPSQQPRGVVMQPVPVDPLAGPVATHAPRSLQPKTEAGNDTLVKSEAPKPVVEAAKPVPVAKPAPTAKVSLPVKAADVKPGATPAAPKVLPPAPVKTADAKPADAKATAKTADIKPASKEAIPGLRLSANAY